MSLIHPYLWNISLYKNSDIKELKSLKPEQVKVIFIKQISWDHLTRNKKQLV
jgi:hypothetical protein